MAAPTGNQKRRISVSGGGALRLLFLLAALAVILSCLLTLAACDQNDEAPVVEQTPSETPPEPSDPVGPSETPDPSETPQEKSKFEGVVFKSERVTFDGAMHTLKATGYPAGARLEYSAEGYVNAGVYDMSVTLSMDGYEDLTLHATLTILQKELSLRFDGAVFEYDGTAHSIYISGDLPSDAVVTYFNNGQIAAGTYDVTARVMVNSNYVPVADMHATLVITVKTFDVTFVHWDGEEEVRQVVGGGSLTELPVPHARPYYEVAWDTTDLKNISADMTVTEVCTPIVYRVDYILNGGINENDNCAVGSQGKYYYYTVESPVLTLSDPLRGDDVFLGWYELETEERVYSVPDEGGPRNMTLIAIWEEDLKPDLSSFALDRPYDNSPRKPLLNKFLKINDKSCCKNRKFIL